VRCVRNNSLRARTIDSVGVFIFNKYDDRIIGEIFCTVMINKQFIHLRPSITLGNHPCSGAAPIFIRSGVMIAYECILLVIII
jgi:hypothetical protein